MSEIISPITGIKEERKKEVKVARPKTKKIKKETDELIPIISPFMDLLIILRMKKAT